MGIPTPFFGPPRNGVRGGMAVFALALFLNSPVWAQAERPMIMAVRIDAQDAPIIDGDLSDPVWARAMAIDDFKQKRPNPGAPPSERTVLRILYDENNLYFSVYAYDSMPDQIAVRAMARDGPITTGDKFSLYIDPGPTRRDRTGKLGSDLVGRRTIGCGRLYGRSRDSVSEHFL